MSEEQNVQHPLKEELGEVDLELKELFMKMEYEAMQELLAGQDPEDIAALIRYNHGIVEKYVNSDRMDLIRKFITFVAFSSFMVEYGLAAGLISAEEKLMELYQEIFDRLQAEKE